jgi:hypothetical protein
MKLKLAAALLSICFFTNAQQLLTYNWSGGMGDTFQDDNIGGSAVDGGGNTIITGRMSGTVDFDPGPGVASYTQSGKAFVAKYDNSGAFQWVAIFTGTGMCAGTSIDVDAANNIYVTGYFQSGDIDFDFGPGTATLTPNQTDMFIVKYNSAGVFQWAKQVGSLSTAVESMALRATPAGSVYIAGYFNMSCDFDPGAGVATLTNTGVDDAFVLKLDNNGIYQWAFSIGAGGTDHVYAMDINGSGDVVITGIHEYTVDLDPGVGTSTVAALGGGGDLFVAKYTSAGNYLWGGTMGEADGIDEGTCIKFTTAGDVLIGGVTQSTQFDIDPLAGVNLINKVGSPGVNDLYIGMLSGTNGSMIWGRLTGAVNQPANVMPRCIALDGTSKFYITGSFGDQVDFDLNAGTYTMMPINVVGEDIFFAQYSLNNANFLNAYQLGGGNSSPYSTGVFIKVTGNTVYLTGNITKDTDMDPGPATTLIIPGGEDFFIAKYTECQMPQLGGLSNPGFVCAGTTLTLSVTSGTLNDATNWQWYNSSCGVGSLGAGLNVTTTAVANTTYYVRGEGGCVPGGVGCITTTVTVAPLTNMSGALTNPTVNPVNGRAILFKYEPMYTKFDTIVKQTLSGGNYSFTSVPAGTYILMAEPTATNLQVTYSGDQTSWLSANTFTHGCAVNSIHNINVVGLTTFTGTGGAVLTGKIVEGLKYGQKGSNITAPGAPIKGISVKGGKNPGGNIGAQDRTKPDGTYTLTGLTVNGTNESYFILVDVPGLDTNGTYHKVIVTGSEIFSNLDFVIDSAKVNPQVFVGLNEKQMIVKKDIKVYPNPSNSKLYISLELTNTENVNVELFDLSGRSVKAILTNSRQEAGPLTIITDNSQLSSGVYILEMMIGSRKEQMKIIKTE